MQVTELNRAAFDNALSYAIIILANELKAFAECENQEVFFEQFCLLNNIDFAECGTPNI